MAVLSPVCIILPARVVGMVTVLVEPYIITVHTHLTNGSIESCLYYPCRVVGMVISPLVDGRGIPVGATLVCSLASFSYVVELPTSSNGRLATVTCIA